MTRAVLPCECLVKLNVIEKALMNNPVRSLLQWHYEAPLLRRLGGQVAPDRVLEIGCGRGVGTQILLERFGARQVVAFDLDRDMVLRARHRLRAVPSHTVQLTVADATAIPVATASVDAVFDFGAIHHVPAWRGAVAEIARVLRPRGRFFFEEVTRQALNRWPYRTFLEHPAEERFTAAEFLAELQTRGILVDDRVTTRCFGDFVFGVGQVSHQRTR